MQRKKKNVGFKVSYLNLNLKSPTMLGTLTHAYNLISEETEAG
jgi:hypothetical protein